MAAPVFVQEVETAYSATSPKTTASFDANAGDVLVAYVLTADDGDTADISNNGAALTWTQQELINVDTYTWVSVWTHQLAADRAGLTVTYTRVLGSNFFGGAVLTFRGSGGIGAAEKTNVASGAPSLSITTLRADSALVVVSADWNAVDGASRTWRTVNSITPTSGNSLERTYFRDAAQYTAYGAYYNDAGTAAAKTVGLSAPTGQKYSIAAVEIIGNFPAPPLIVTR